MNRLYRLWFQHSSPHPSRKIPNEIFRITKKKDSRGRDLILENAIISTVSISNDCHGFLTAWLHIEFDCGGCSFGGFALGKATGGNLNQKGHAAEFIVRCLNVVGATEWNDLEGEPIRCLHEDLGGGIVAIGNFLKDEWFCPKIEFDNS